MYFGGNKLKKKNYHVSGFGFLPLLLSSLPLLDLLLQPRVLLIRHDLLAFFVIQIFAFKPANMSDNFNFKMKVVSLSLVVMDQWLRC